MNDTFKSQGPSEESYKFALRAEIGLEKSQTTFSEIASLSFAMSFFFGFSQLSGFIARIVFKLSLTPDDYGVFAFFINLFPFFTTLNGFSLHVPIISMISEKPLDDELYKDTQAQIFTSSFITGILLSVLLFTWTFLTTSSLILSSFFAIMTVVYSTSQVLHCFPRGKDRLRPAAVSLLIVGISRIVLLFAFFLIWNGDLFAAALIYTLPVLGWWVSFFLHEGVPSLSRPKLKSIIPIYKDASFSSLHLLGRQLPPVLGIALLTYLHGFSVAGDFDIAMIPYSGLTVAFSGISFVTISKARKLPEFRSTMRKLASHAILPLVIVFGAIAVFANQLEAPAKHLVSLIGLPASAYWAAVILVVLGVPAGILLSLLVGYLQGRGIIKPVGIIAIVSALSIFPILYFLIMIFSVEGAALAISLGDALIAFILVIFGYAKLKPSVYSYSQNNVS